MLKIEISFTTDEDKEPEHYGYYDDIESAKEDLDNIEKIVSQGCENDS